MAIATNARVWVRAPFKRGTGTVLEVRRDHTVRVCLDSGSTVRVALGQVSVLEGAEDRKPPPANRLTRHPDTGLPKLRPVAKEGEARSSRYLAWLRTLPCAWCKAPAPSEASHHPPEGGGSTGRKAADCYAIPLCHECHADWHRRTALGAMTSSDTKTWCLRTALAHLWTHYTETR